MTYQELYRQVRDLVDRHAQLDLRRLNGDVHAAVEIEELWQELHRLERQARLEDIAAQIKGREQ